MKTIPLCVGYEHECDYLEGKRARMAYVSPRIRLDRFLYSELAAGGFRRSGELAYRPYCAGCSQCIPARIPVDKFLPNRSQQRVLKRNSDLSVVGRPPVFNEEHYGLYKRYLLARHPAGHMADSSREDYVGFISSGWGDTVLYEFRCSEQLLAVAVVDNLEEALSAVYTFFDPESACRSLGTHAVLWQVSDAQKRGFKWVYLGFWISGCRKMAYKNQFRPLQLLQGKAWVTVGKGEIATGKVLLSTF